MSPSDDMRRGNDLVLDPVQFAEILDLTKGKVGTYVGPTKQPLGADDSPVLFDGKSFIRCSVGEATQNFLGAGEGDYIVLENPAKDSSHPHAGMNGEATDLLPGQKVNIPGPVSFALWPGQAARVREGHSLRSNQFLVAVVYNAEKANANWGKTVMTPQEPQEPQGDKGDEGAKGEGETKTPEVVVSEVKVGDLTMGKRLIIKGTEVSFFIPPTGIEVVPDEEDRFVRDAVTLETLEYCILVGENGEKRYVRGADVVFPDPTEDFVRRTAERGKKTRKFKAIELNEESGIYVKVIANYTEDDEEHKEGDELFITGKEQRIYFPRPEHAIVKYDVNSKKMYAITIPAGEARYVLDKRDQKISMIKGSKIFLPDPRYEVIVRRVLSEKEVRLWFPGNTKAASYNADLAAMKVEGMTHGYVSELAARAANEQGMSRGAMAALSEYEEAGPTHIGDMVKRQTQYTPPRTLIIDSKFDGAVLIDVWTGYAVQVRNKTGDHEVVVGPKPRLLEYDETLDGLELSMGTPKTRKHGTLKTVYLRVTNNRVSDKIKAQTGDLVDVSLVVAYRVDFGGEKERWFDVEDYVQLLTEHTRSMIRNHVKQLGVQEFMANSVALVRDMVLGAPGEDGKRAGLKFEENGMEVRDVEVLDVTIGAEHISDLLFETQHEVVRQAVSLASEERSLELSQKRAEIARQIARDTHETAMAQLDLDGKVVEKKTALALQRLADSKKVHETDLEATKAGEAVKDATEEHRRGRAKAVQELELSLKKVLAEVESKSIEDRTAALVKQMEAIKPDLIAALQVHGDKVLTAGVVKELGAVAAITGDSVDGVFKRILQGTVLADVFTGNGAAAGVAAQAMARSGLRQV